MQFEQKLTKRTKAPAGKQPYFLRFLEHHQKVTPAGITRSFVYKALRFLRLLLSNSD
jgi:hypothetical protein